VSQPVYNGSMICIFCRRCGASLKHITENRYKCPNGHTIFDNASPAVGAFIVDDDFSRVTLSVRGIEPRKGMLDAFGGFVSDDESLEKALGRELEEELGLKPHDYTLPHYLCSQRGHYPFEGDDLAVMSSLYFVQLKPGATPRPADDVADTATFSIMEVPLAKLHDDDIRVGIRALQAHAKKLL